MDRRAFLKLLAGTAGATAAGLVLPEVEPVRRWWQVGRGAPVGERSDRYVMGIDPAAPFTVETTRTAGIIMGVQRPGGPVHIVESAEDVRRLFGEGHYALEAHVEAQARKVERLGIIDIEMRFGGGKTIRFPSGTLTIG